MSENTESVAGLRARSEQRLGRHQRLAETLTDRLGRPATVYVVLILVALWAAVNLLWPWSSPPDPAPFFWMQGVVALAGLLMTTLVLITENRQSTDADHRTDLDLRVNLATEHKVAKLIALIEELRRDLPMVRDRVDLQAVRMQAHLDPQRVMDSIEARPDAEK